MIPVRNGLRLHKVLLRIPLLGANRVRKKTIDNLMILPMWKLPRHTVSQDALLVWAQHTDVLQYCSIHWYLAFSWRKTLLSIASTLKEMDFYGRTCRFTLRQRQGHTSTKCELPATSSVTISPLSLSCSQGKVTQQRPEAVLPMQCSTGEHSLLYGSLTAQCMMVFWVASLYLPYSISCSLGCFQLLLRNRCPSSESRRSINCSWGTDSLYSSALSFDNALMSS